MSNSKETFTQKAELIAEWCPGVGQLDALQGNSQFEDGPLSVA